MKLNKELLKKGFKNQLVSIGHMLIFCSISAILFWLSYIGTKLTGNTSRSFLSLTEYKTNNFFEIFSWLLFLI